MSKPKIALYWCSSCGGCEESVLDLAEGLLDVRANADIVFWPVALDAKHADLEKVGDGEIKAAFINGAVRMDDQEAMALLLRRKSQWIVAHGSCAHTGGVVGLANFYDREAILRTSYQDLPTLGASRTAPPARETVENGRKMVLSGFHERVRALDQVIDVDFYIPGCPPTPALVKEALGMVLSDTAPPSGTVLGDTRALCHTCSLKKSRKEHPGITKFKRIHEAAWDPEECFLNQSLICLGPATRGGCGARCIRANMPCRGCFGPVGDTRDQGASVLSFLAALIDSRDPETLAGCMRSIPDPAGLLYRYGLASSTLGGKTDGRIS